MGKHYFLSDTMTELACECVLSCSTARIGSVSAAWCCGIVNDAAGVARTLATLLSRGRSSSRSISGGGGTSSSISLEDAFTFIAAPLNLKSKAQVTITVATASKSNKGEKARREVGVWGRPMKGTDAGIRVELKHQHSVAREHTAYA